MNGIYCKLARVQGSMVSPFCNDDGVSFDSLFCDIISFGSSRASQVQSMTLADGVVKDAIVFTNFLAISCNHVTLQRRDILLQETREFHLSDKAYPLRVLSIPVWEACIFSHQAHLFFCKVTYWK